jgi:anti-anti-sigma regulatory factor
MRNRQDQRVRPFPLRARPGDHICWAYTNDSGLQAALAGYLNDGLIDGQRVQAILPAEQLDSTVDGLERTNADLRQARRDGSISYESSDDAYLSANGFDIDERIGGWIDAIDRAIFDGYSGLRVFGDATPILLDPLASQDWPIYELRADILSVSAPFVAMCAYDARRIGVQSMSTVQAIHPTLVGAASTDQFHLHGGLDGGLCLGGEADLLWAPTLERLGTAVGSSVPTPSIDARGLTFIDIAGMRALARTVDSMGDRHPCISIYSSRGSVERLWHLLDCDNSVDTEVVFA